LRHFRGVERGSIHDGDVSSRALAEAGREYLSAGIPWLTFLVMLAAR
jgi:hypothetical protein